MFVESTRIVICLENRPEAVYIHDFLKKALDEMDLNYWNPDALQTIGRLVRRLDIILASKVVG